jgi:hypothetical protein
MKSGEINEAGLQELEVKIAGLCGKTAPSVRGDEPAMDAVSQKSRVS